MLELLLMWESETARKFFLLSVSFFYWEVKTFVTDVAIVLLLLAAQYLMIWGSNVGYTVLYVIAIVSYLISVILTVYSGVFYLVKNKELFSQCK